MNKEAKLWFGWVEVIAMWSYALACLLLHFWFSDQGNLSTLANISLMLGALLGGIALIGTMVLMEGRLPQPKDQPYQVGTTPWDRDDHGKFWDQPHKS